MFPQNGLFLLFATTEATFHGLQNVHNVKIKNQARRLKHNDMTNCLTYQAIKNMKSLVCVKLQISSTSSKLIETIQRKNSQVSGNLQILQLQVMYLLACVHSYLQVKDIFILHRDNLTT